MKYYSAVLYFNRCKMKITFRSILLFFLFLIAVVLWMLPGINFTTAYSYVLYDENGELLDYQVANDGQWRIKYTSDSIPKKYLYCLLMQEDKRFFFHSGVDYWSLLRAAFQNIKYGRKYSGGSTITMQVARMYLGNKKRTYTQKIIELFLSYYIELKYNKYDILKFYLQYAPFGGNVVGAESASFRYFNRPLHELSWSESALLAVLPKNPSNVNVKRNVDILKKRRNLLLYKLFTYQLIDSLTYEISKNDSIVISDHFGNHEAPHLLAFLKNTYPDYYTYHTYIQLFLQKQVYEILERYKLENDANGIRNAAVLVCKLPEKRAIVYIGNYIDKGSPLDAYHVNMIEAKRSGGSILKPFLYATMLNEGELTPDMLLPDIPMQIGGYAPKNFNLTYEGAVKANNALVKSLNVPAVKMLQLYGVQRFIDFLKKMNFSTITRSQDYYGLSLILGGCEIKMSELMNAYANMSNLLTNNEITNSLMYFKGMNKQTVDIPLSKGSVWLTFQAMNEVERPKNQGYWYLFRSKKTIAWKTGTSFGYRDAWAVGITPDYAVVVWVGNATGKSSADLTGIKKAAPILFDIFSILHLTNVTYPIPYDDLQMIRVCKQSGYLPSPFCNEIVNEIVCKKTLKIQTCPYHKLVYLDSTCKYRVNSECESVHNIRKRSYFVLPPAMELYYRRKNPSYEMLPPFRNDCIEIQTQQNNIEIIYPQNYTNLYIPRNLDGTLSSVIFEATHRKTDASLFWYLDGQWVAQTQNRHTISLQPSLGKHELLIQDENGETKIIEFNVVYSPK